MDMDMGTGMGMNGNGNDNMSIIDIHKKKTIILLGVYGEVVPIDMTYIDDGGVEVLVDFVYRVMYRELLSRSIRSLHDWSSRVNTLFLRHNMVCVEHIVILSKNEVNRLSGCGYKTRKEIYDVCKSYGLDLPSWYPGDYYERKNYIFTD